MKRRRLYPPIRLDARAASAVSQAGGVLLVETIRAAGLDEGLGQALAPWRKPGVVHDPAKVVLDLALSKPHRSRSGALSRSRHAARSRKIQAKVRPCRSL